MEHFHKTLLGVIQGFYHDPPDSDFQRGYLAALAWAAKEVGLERVSGEADDFLARNRASLSSVPHH